MVHRLAIFTVAVSIAGAAGVARAESVIVIPGRADVPVVINNYDARWAVVEGEEGLNRPGHVVPTVIGGRFIGPVRGPIRRSGYYPSTGTKPAQGRLEQEPTDRATPTAAEDYSRSWSSTPQLPAATVPPADLPNPNSGPMGEGGNPPIIVVPQFGPKRGP